MKPVLISAMVLMGMASWAQAQTPQQWDQCVERVGRTVDVQEVGQIGYENAIKDACGVRPLSNAGMAKSPTQTLRTQSNHVFMAIYAVFKLECLSVKSKINPFALRFKLLINATRSAFDQLQKFQAAA